MRKRTKYSTEFKEKVLSKALAPNAPSIVELARRAGIPDGTLNTWLYMNRKNKITKLDSNIIPMRPKDLTAENKLKAIVDTFQMNEEWKQQILAGLKPIGAKKEKTGYRQLAVEIKVLKRELTRKDKALAESSALLILKKSEFNLGGQQGH